MGGIGRRAEIGQDIDSYISNVRRRKPFSIARARSKQSSRTWWPWSARLETLPKRSQNIEIEERITLIHDKHAQMREGISLSAMNWWETLKSNLRNTVKKDLQSIDTNSTGGTTMKQDDDFIDFEEGGLKVVPIPDEPEPVRSTPKSAPASKIMMDPFSIDEPKVTPSKPALFAKPSPVAKNEGFFSRWFGSRSAAKEEATFDNDFLLDATVAKAASEDNSKELREDFKELSKLFLKSLERMNKDQLSQFKTTDDFDRFKDLLKKHKVIK